MPTTTSPDEVRQGLIVVASTGAAELTASTAAAQSPGEVRSALFATAPLVAETYGQAAAVLGADWYEELRDEADLSDLFVPEPVLNFDEDSVRAMVAVVTAPLEDLSKQAEAEIEALYEQILADVVAEVEREIQKEIVTGFRDTITENAKADPGAAGWKRHAQPDACKFCRMLAAKGAVYTEETARFAAHTNCYCIAGPAFGGQEIWAQATPMQYLASQRKRTEAERAQLREYLNRKYPDAPG